MKLKSKRSQGYSLNGETFLQRSVLLPTLEHHEETRFFTAMAEGWKEKEDGRGGVRTAEEE